MRPPRRPSAAGTPGGHPSGQSSGRAASPQDGRPRDPRPPRSKPGATRNAPRRVAEAPTRLPDRYLYGLHAVRAAIANPERVVTRIQATEAGLAALAEALEAARAAGIDRPAPEIVDRALMDRFLRGAVHQGVSVEIRPLDAPDLDDIGRAASIAERMVVVVLDQVTDPHNVGAILRSAAAFGAAALIVTDRHAPEVTGVLAKSASGAVEQVPLVRVRNLARALDALGEWGFDRVGLAEEAEATLAQTRFGPLVALVLGGEGEGLRQLTRSHCDRLARLPTAGPVASLNVSNAAAIALYEAVRGG